MSLWPILRGLLICIDLKDRFCAVPSRFLCLIHRTCPRVNTRYVRLVRQGVHLLSTYLWTAKSLVVGCSFSGLCARSSLVTQTRGVGR